MPSSVRTRTKVASKCVRGTGSHAAMKGGSSGSLSRSTSIAVIFTSLRSLPCRPGIPNMRVPVADRGLTRDATKSAHLVSTLQCNDGKTREAGVDNIRVGIIGAGWIAQAHQRIIESLDGADVVAVCDLDRARAEALAGGAGVQVYTDWRDLLGREEL